MLSPKIILLLTLSALAISAHTQNISPPPPQEDTTAIKDTSLLKWRKCLDQNVNRNVPVKYGAPSGIYTVYVQFIASGDGTISDIRALTNFGYGMEAEVVRALKKGPSPWKPAIQGGKRTNIYGKLPFTFIVPADGYTISTKMPYVLFTDIDNEIAVEVEKVKKGNVKLFIPDGKITTAGDGKYIVRVNKPGSIIIELYDRKMKKRRLIGSASFEVKDAKEN